jgi:uncharacterized protein Smg (DUF494 family)
LARWLVKSINIENGEPVGYFPTMSFAELLEELPALTVEQRQMVIRRALELEGPQLNEAEETLVDARLAAHRQNPASSVPLSEMKQRLRSHS